MELAGMWQRDVVRATPWVVVRCCNRTSRTTAWRHEGTSLAEAGSGGKHEKRTFIPPRLAAAFCVAAYSARWAPWRPGPERLDIFSPKCRCRPAGCQSMAPLLRWPPAALERLAAVSGPADGLLPTSLWPWWLRCQCRVALQPHVHSWGSWSLDTCRSVLSCSYIVARLMEATGVRSFPVAVLRAGHAVAAGTAAWTGIELQRGHVVGTTNIQGCVGHWSQAFCQVVDQPRCPGWGRLCSGSGVGAAASGWRSPLRARRFAFPAGGDCRGWGLLAAAQRWCQGSCLLSSSGGPLWWHRRMLRLHSRECSALCLSSERRDEAHPQRCPAAW